MSKPSALETATQFALAHGLYTGRRNAARFDILVRYRASDGARSMRRFKTVEGARAYAQRMIGAGPEIGGSYAVSGDGIGTIRVEGATLRDLFPASFG